MAVHENAHIAGQMQTNSIRNTNPSDSLHIISADTLQIISPSKKNLFQLGKSDSFKNEMKIEIRTNFVNIDVLRSR